MSMELENSFSEVEENSENGNATLTFVTKLKNFPILLEKSQVPAVIIQKKAAALKLINDLELDGGKRLNENQLFKKINNMKTSIKKKTDEKATGNKKIILSAWEKLFFEMLQPQTNPVFSKVPGTFINLT